MAGESQGSGHRGACGQPGAELEKGESRVVPSNMVATDVAVPQAERIFGSQWVQ